MGAGETARAAYDSARQELIKRIELRDKVLIFYLTVAGTLLGISFGTTARAEILFVIPFVAVGSAILVAQHHSTIGALGHFVSHELYNFLVSISESSPQWDNSQALKIHSNKSLRYRAWGQNILLIIPCIITMLINYKHTFSWSLYGFVWWIAMFCSIGAVVIIHKVHNLRKKIYKNTDWKI